MAVLFLHFVSECPRWSHANTGLRRSTQSVLLRVPSFIKINSSSIRTNGCLRYMVCLITDDRLRYLAVCVRIVFGLTKFCIGIFIGSVFFDYGINISSFQLQLFLTIRNYLVFFV